LKLKKFKKIKKIIANRWYILLKNINYLNTNNKKNQINQKLTKIKTLIKDKTKMRTKLNKKN